MQVVFRTGLYTMIIAGILSGYDTSVSVHRCGDTLLNTSGYCS